MHADDAKTHLASTKEKKFESQCEDFYISWFCLHNDWKSEDGEVLEDWCRDVTRMWFCSWKFAQVAVDCLRCGFMKTFVKLPCELCKVFVNNVTPLTTSKKPSPMSIKLEKKKSRNISKFLGWKLCCYRKEKKSSSPQSQLKVSIGDANIKQDLALDGISVFRTIFGFIQQKKNYESMFALPSKIECELKNIPARFLLTFWSHDAEIKV